MSTLSTHLDIRYWMAYVALHGFLKGPMQLSLSMCIYIYIICRKHIGKHSECKGKLYREYIGEKAQGSRLFVAAGSPEAP